jgi:uncharacterized membrane protein YedE/YeeE
MPTYNVALPLAIEAQPEPPSDAWQWLELVAAVLGGLIVGFGIGFLKG